MADEQENFVPRSDEDLARLLEEQMRDLRAQTSEIQPLTASTVSSGDGGSAHAQSPERDSELDEIFSALLEDNPAPVAVVETVSEAVVEVELVAEAIEPEFKPTAVEAELAQTEPIDVVPIPSMFTESSSEEAYIAAALEPEVVVAAASVTVIDEIFDDGTIEETVIEQVVINDDVVEEVIIEQIVEQVSDSKATNPITSFERRPSFDELVFGTSAED